jgi:hypothetical protein
MTKQERVFIRRQWNDYRTAEVELSRIEGLHWDIVSGGVRAPSPQPFVHGYVKCTDVIGDIAHSCSHGEAPHTIKVCIVKKDNDPKIWQKILSIVGPKPKKR